MPKLNITQASIVALLTSIAGFVVAVVPSWSNEVHALIGAAAIVVPSIFAIVHALPFHQAAAKSVNADVPFKLVPVEKPSLPQGAPRGQ